MKGAWLDKKEYSLTKYFSSSNTIVIAYKVPLVNFNAVGTNIIGISIRLLKYNTKTGYTFSTNFPTPYENYKANSGLRIETNENQVIQTTISMLKTTGIQVEAIGMVNDIELSETPIKVRASFIVV